MALIALQKHNFDLAKKAQNADREDAEVDAMDDSAVPRDSVEAAVPDIVPLDLAMQFPAAVALHLVQKERCTGEQADAVALLAHSLQKRFEARPDKSTVMLLVATPNNNHRIIWPRGGGCGKTRTLTNVVQPLAETFFGAGGYSATVQSNMAASNLHKQQ